MPLDIFAPQHLYGPNRQTNAVDTACKFTSDSGDYLAGSTQVRGNPAGKLLLTIWDGGGSDTLDFTAYERHGFFDTRPCRFSTPSPGQCAAFKHGDVFEGSIAMALLPKGYERAPIENIIVGDGDSLITANEAANRITLGAGANRVAFHPGGRKDVIAGFGADDAIDLSGYQVPPEMIHSTSEGEDALITIDQLPDDEIRVLNFAASPQYVLR
jgi:serralysin